MGTQILLITVGFPFATMTPSVCKGLYDPETCFYLNFAPPQVKNLNIQKSIFPYPIWKVSITTESCKSMFTVIVVDYPRKTHPVIRVEGLPILQGGQGRRPHMNVSVCVRVRVCVNWGRAGGLTYYRWDEVCLGKVMILTFYTQITSPQSVCQLI